MRVGLIGGTGWALPSGEDASVRVETPFGAVTMHVTDVAGHRAFLVHRHADGSAFTTRDRDGAEGGVVRHTLPPHRVNHKANVWALSACRVDRVIALVSTGALRTDVPVPGLLVPDDFVDFSGHAQRSFFEDAPVHVGVDPPYCPVTRRALLAGGAGLAVHDGGVYAAVPGPRLETPAEVRFLAAHAHVVGMTGCPEAALAREQGLCYAQLALVANHATGVAAGEVSAQGIKAASARLAEDAARVVDAAVRRLEAGEGACGCARALDSAHI